MSERSAAPAGRPGPNSAAASTADTVSRVLRASTAASQQGADDSALGSAMFFFSFLMMAVATAVLTVPRMEVTSLGDALQVQFERLPVTAVVKVTVWRRGYEQQVRPSCSRSTCSAFIPSCFIFSRFHLFTFLFFICFHFSSLFWIEKCGFIGERGSESSFDSLPQPAVYTTLAGQTVLHVAARQEGAEYCIRAQTVLDSQLFSRSTDTQCVTITGTHTRHDGRFQSIFSLGIFIIIVYFF